MNRLCLWRANVGIMASPSLVALGPLRLLCLVAGSVGLRIVVLVESQPSWVRVLACFKFCASASLGHFGSMDAVTVDTSNVT
jgi:hypothetical protein